MKLGWKIFIAVLLLLIVGGVFAWWRASGKAAPIKTATVEKHDVTQEVIFTARLRSKQRAQIAFESSGTLAQVPVSLGDSVAAGQVLAKLDPRSVQLESDQARATQLAGAQNARIAWNNAETAWQTTKTEQAAVVAAKQQTVRDAKKEMDQAQDVWQQTVRESGDEPSLTKAKYSIFLSAQSVYRAAQKSLTQIQDTATKTVAAARGSADAAQAAYISTQQAAPTTSGLSATQAAQALANLRVVKAVARAPFAGVVTAKAFETGELAPAGTPVITVETVGDLEVVADVPESDMVKLQPDMMGQITLDALPSETNWQANITSIAPAAKILEGVPTYEVTLQLLQSSPALKPGMTANLTIQAVRHEGVPAIPRRAVVRSGGVYHVQVLNNGLKEDRQVEIGTLGTDGFIEITKGLNIGEVVVLDSSAK